MEGTKDNKTNILRIQKIGRFLGPVAKVMLIEF